MLANASNPLSRPKQDETADLDKELEKILFAYVICKKEYKAPIITKCGHYFCEACAIDRYRKKNPSCAICGGRTDGVFNVAKGLQKKLEKKKKRIEQKEMEEVERERIDEEAGPVIQGGWWHVLGYIYNTQRGRSCTHNPYPNLYYIYSLLQYYYI